MTMNTLKFKITVVSLVLYSLITFKAQSQRHENSNSKLIEENPEFPEDERYNDIFPLTYKNFTEKLIKQKDAWVVIFHDGTLTKSWKTMAASLRGIVWVGMIHCKEESKLLKQIEFSCESKKLPRGRVYPYGRPTIKKDKWVEVVNANEARVKVTLSLPDKTQRVKSKDVQDFMVESYMSQPSRFPAILLTNEIDTPALFKALAIRFEKYFNFGIMIFPTTEDLNAIGAGQFFLDIPSLICMVVPDSKEVGPASIKMSAVPYQVKTMGDMNYANILHFLFAVNSQFRHTLPGDNRSNQQTVVEMLDIIEVEQQRFNITTRETKLKQEKEEMGIKSGTTVDNLQYSDNDIRDEL